MRRTKNMLINVFNFLLPFIVLIIFWEFLVDLNVLSSKLLPPPSQIIKSFCGLLYPKPILLEHLYKSFVRLILGYGLGVVVGVSFGILMGINGIFYKLFSPIISLLISVPTLAWVPLLLITLGLGDKTIIFAIFLGAFFPIVYNTMNGVRGVKKQFIWVAKSMGASSMKIFFHVLLPGSLTSVITGLRLALGYSWRALVGAEMLAATEWGIGYMIYAARALYDLKIMFVGLIIIAGGGFFLDRLLLSSLERKTIEKWGVVKKR